MQSLGINPYSTTPMTQSGQQLPGQDRPTTQIAAQSTTAKAAQAKPVIYPTPLRIRPIDDPIKWLKLIEGNKAVAIGVLYQQVIKQLQQNRYSDNNQNPLKPLLDICQKDPARLLLVINYGKNLSEKNRDRQDLKLLNKIEVQLQSKYGAQINGGLNTAKALSLYSSDGELLQNLRNTYYSTIIGKRSVNALFNAMVDLLGEPQLATGMAVMQKALNDDLMGSYPSVAPTPQLNALLSDSAIVQQLTGLFGLCRDLLEKVNRHICPTSLEDADLTRRVVNMTTSSFYLRELQRLNVDTVGDQPDKQLVFLNYFYPLVKQLPGLLWADLQQRNNTLMSILRFMDQQTLSNGDYQYRHSADDKDRQAVNAKLTLQAGVPVITTQRGNQ